MRETGWYWTKRSKYLSWGVSYFDGMFWMVATIASPQPEDWFEIIGPKIEQPKEQSDE